MPTADGLELIEASYAYKDGRIDSQGKPLCVELPARYDANPTRWMNQAEVIEIQEAIEDLIGTTFQTLQVARSLLNETQNSAKLRQVLDDYRHDRNFLTWVSGKGLAAFAFKRMVLTKYHAKKKAGYELGKPWSDEIDKYVNR